jgi:hypothetical protein
MIFLIFKIIVIIFNFFGIIFIKGEILTPMDIFKINDKRKFYISKIYRFFEYIRYYINWNMFSGLGDNFIDIKITTKTKNGKQDIWYLRKDKNIGSFKLNSNNTRVTLSFRYNIDGYLFFHEYLIEMLKYFYFKQNDVFLYLKVERNFYSSFENRDIVESRSKPIGSEVLFEWNGVYNANTGYL